jgi:FemAB-related protein (PEP-CTERM system-associated)
MITERAAPLLSTTDVRLHAGPDLLGQLSRLAAYVTRSGKVPLSRHPAWLTVLERGLRHVPYCLEVVTANQTRGLLPLAFVRSWLFGRFLVSLPYLNYGGVVADDDASAAQLVTAAAALADRLDVRFLELRNELPFPHALLGQATSAKVHMRLDLPDTADKLWKQIPAKVRSQVRKGQKGDFTVAWGGLDQLPEFYEVFSQNMRDLGTPVYGQGLFRNLLEQFPGRAELCIVRASSRAIGGALLLHGWGVTEVPSASTLRSFLPSCANMLMYWHLLARAVDRQQATFDFGRSSQDSSTYRFKKQWGACPHAAVWQYYLRQGGAAEMRPDNPKYQRLIRMWQRLPVSLTRWIGPRIVRGIP